MAKLTQIFESNQMKNIALLSILGLALLQPAVEAFFLGPIAVGAALGPSPLEKNSYLALSCLKEDLANKVIGNYLVQKIIDLIPAHEDAEEATTTCRTEGSITTTPSQHITVNTLSHPQ